jgi:hypothetical protein
VPFDPDYVRWRYAGDDFNTAAEEPVMAGKGLIVKARFPSDSSPNVLWYWLPIGNCHVCRYYQPPRLGDPTLRCRNPRIAPARFERQLQQNDCPEYAPGMRPETTDRSEYDRRRLDVLKAIGLVDGSPSEPIEILQQLPWSRWRSHQAHLQQEAIIAMARAFEAGYGDEAGMDTFAGDDLGDIPEDAEPRDARGD